MITHHGYEPECCVVLDNVWHAMKFKKVALEPKIPARITRRTAIAAEL